MTAGIESSIDELGLLRAFEPVVRLTQGEYFMPVGVAAYVRNSSLWLQNLDGESQRLASPGELDLDLLALLLFPLGCRTSSNQLLARSFQCGA